MKTTTFELRDDDVGRNEKVVVVGISRYYLFLVYLVPFAPFGAELTGAVEF